MKFLMIADFRDNMQAFSIEGQQGNSYNDHPTNQNIKTIIDAVVESGFECQYFGGIPELIDSVNMKRCFIDTYFLNFTDGLEQDYSRVQAPVLLDILDVPHSGSSTFPSALMNNKQHTKYALQNIDINIPKSITIKRKSQISKRLLQEFQYPLFIKPNCEGSSIGISKKNICFTYLDIQNNAEGLLTQFSEIIIEEYIMGQDVTNFIIGNPNDYRINDVILAKLHDKDDYAIYGAEEKLCKKRTLYWNDEKLNPLIVRKIQSLSTDIFEYLGASDVIRIDYRIKKDTDTVYFIEANSMPRFSESSEVGFICQKRNISFSTAVSYYVETFIKRIKTSN